MTFRLRPFGFKTYECEPCVTKLLFVSQEYLNRKNSGSGYNIHQPQGNKKYGTEKSGFLLKKSDGCVKNKNYCCFLFVHFLVWVLHDNKKKKIKDLMLAGFELAI